MPLMAMRGPSVPRQICAGYDATYGPYFLCGWKVISALELPELTPWPCHSERAENAFEISILLAEDCTAAHAEPYRYAVDANGEVLLQVPGVAIYRVSRDGRTITLQPVECADPQLLRAHLYGSIVAILCFLRGLLPLHGACVRMGDSAVIFTGASGAGKSTLAAAFARRGFSLLCDDVCAIDMEDTQKPKVWPAFSRVKLLPDAMEAFALDRDTLYTQAVRGEKGHFLVSSPEGEVCDPLPIAAIYLLHTSTDGRIERTTLHGASAFLPIKTQVHRSAMGTEMGLRGRLFQELSTLLRSVPVFQLSRPMDLKRVDDVVRMIAELHNCNAVDA